MKILSEIALLWVDEYSLRQNLNRLKRLNTFEAFEMSVVLPRWGTAVKQKVPAILHHVWISHIKDKWLLRNIKVSRGILVVSEQGLCFLRIVLKNYMLGLLQPGPSLADFYTLPAPTPLEFPCRPWNSPWEARVRTSSPAALH